ncbi:uncharacterized protein LOC111083790, partial [Limulus polyphemus]|uniref:Uncharacterized protein LOC111083790 n=1 Tax=Limulus polyphemus TaxID=6850 RepID=A0ABM1RXT5_LIMPO
KQSLEGVEKMREVLKVTDVPHPSDLKDLTNRIQGESFVKSDLVEAENEMNFDATEPNPFILFDPTNFIACSPNSTAQGPLLQPLEISPTVSARVNGLWFSENIRQKPFTKTIDCLAARKIVEDMKTISAEIKSNVMKKILNGEPVYEVQSPKGFFMSVQKKLGTEMSDYTITQGDAAYFLPDSCDVFHSALDCNKLNETVIGFSAVKWSGVLESYGRNANKVSRGSSTVQIETSSTDNQNATELNVTDTLQPVEMCIPQRGISNRPSSSLREEINTQNASPENLIFYHNVTLVTAETSVSIDIVPSNPDAALIVLVKYGKRPRLHDYDFITRIQDMLEYDGVYNLFLSQFNQSEGGQRFFLGIAHLADHIDPLEFFNDPFRHNLTMDDISTNFTSNYSIAVYTSACLYFEESTETWKGDGCHVTSMDVNRTCCQCNHLTSFGSGFFVAPNTVDFDYVFANANFADNLTIYITLIVTFSIYIILMIWAHWKDKKDVEKLGAAPLPDNDVCDKYLYEIMVFAGHQNNAGTKTK